MAKSRNITNEQILYALIASCKDDAKKNINKEIIVNEHECKQIGYFSYTEKDTGKKISGSIFLISETHDGKLFNIIYDARGNVLGSQSEENGMKLETAKDIEIDEELLNRQLNLEREKSEKETQNDDDGTSSSQKGGEGRDLAEKEHEEMTQEKEESHENEGKEGVSKNIVPNLANEINIDNNFRISLEEVINGSYLWDILNLEEKLKGRMPDNINEKIFRTGYLTAVDSATLSAKDGKPRPTQDTLVVTSFDGKVTVELDETILKPMDLGSNQDKQRVEQDRIRYEDGEEAKKPANNLNTRRTSLFQIPNINERYAVAENWYLGVDYSDTWVNESRTPETRNRKEISFVQVSRNKSYHDREELVQGEDIVEYQLDPISEGERSIGREEDIKQDEKLATRDANEAQNEARSHENSLLEECYETLPELKEYYNERDILSKIDEYHKTMSDEKVIEQIGEDLEYAKDFEHDQPSIDRYGKQ